MSVINRSPNGRGHGGIRAKRWCWSTTIVVPALAMPRDCDSTCELYESAARKQFGLTELPHFVEQPRDAYNSAAVRAQGRIRLPVALRE